jgi:hypothetical protein
MGKKAPSTQSPRERYMYPPHSARMGPGKRRMASRMARFSESLSAKSSG